MSAFSDSVVLQFESQEDFDAYCILLGSLQFEVYISKELIFPCKVELTFNKISGMVLLT
jgi:hypothetical protein